MTNIRVIHLNTSSTTSGAGKGMYILHQGLKEIDIDSQILTAMPDPQNPEHPTYYNKHTKRKLSILHRINQLLLQGPNIKPKGISANFIGTQVLNSNFTKDKNIIHLHWISNGFISLSSIKKQKKPVVWTLRDMWPITGGCHYSLDCTRYRSGCGNCPLISEGLFWDHTRMSHNIKRKSLSNKQNFTPIAISPWLAREAESSGIFGNQKVKYIWNSINRETFQPLEKQKAKKSLNLDIQKKYISIGAINLSSSYKGSKILKNGLEQFFSSPQNRHVGLLSFGNDNLELPASLHLKNFGYVKDEATLNRIYSASSVFIASSIQEAFGKTIAESLSSGTPVVAFNSSAPADMITHLSNGYLANPFDPVDMALGIEWATHLDHHAEANIRQSCIERSKWFCHRNAAKNYKNLYEEILYQQNS